VIVHAEIACPDAGPRPPRPATPLVTDCSVVFAGPGLGSGFGYAAVECDVIE